MVELCVITATIAQSNKLPLHKDKGRATVLFCCTEITKHTNKTFAEASFSRYIDFITPHNYICIASYKKPHSVNSLYGFNSTCCNLNVSVFQNFCNLVAFACKQKFACAFRVFACTSSFAVNTAFARNPCSFWRVATVPQRLLGRVRPHRP